MYPHKKPPAAKPAGGHRVIHLESGCFDTTAAAGVQLGASPRASIALMKSAQALAFFDGFDFVTPDQIQELAVSVIAHRLVMEPQARFSGQTARSVVEEVVKKKRVPA